MIVVFVVVVVMKNPGFTACGLALVNVPYIANL